MWLGLAPELKCPGNFDSGTLSSAIAADFRKNIQDILIMVRDKKFGLLEKSSGAKKVLV